MKSDTARATENDGRDDEFPLRTDIGPLAEKILETSMDGILVCDAALWIVWANRAFFAMTGFARPEVIGQTPQILCSGFHDVDFYAAMRTALEETGGWQGEIWSRRKNGSIFPAWMTIDVIRAASGGVTHCVARYSDLDNRQDLPRTLHRLAYFDAVTGLPNRNLFHDRLQQALIRAARMNSLMAVLFLDLDGFKAINDTLGHDVGDLVLKVVAERLAHCMREGDTLSRLGGDEFAAVLPDLAESATAAQVAERITQAFAAPFPIRGGAVSLTASIGIGLYPSDGGNAAELVRCADRAMYRVKESRGGGHRFFGS